MATPIPMDLISELERTVAAARRSPTASNLGALFAAVDLAVAASRTSPTGPDPEDTQP
jgi:hypothetical protein